MPNEKLLPDSLSGSFVFGVGLGTGIAIVVCVTKRFFRQNTRDNRLVVALKEISSEISELRGVLVALQAKTASSSLAFNETAFNENSLFPVESINEKLFTREVEYTRDVEADDTTSSEDEDFFEVQELDESNRQIANGKR